MNWRLEKMASDTVLRNQKVKVPNLYIRGAVGASARNGLCVEWVFWSKVQEVC
jgi:hypothetical protein